MVKATSLTAMEVKIIFTMLADIFLDNLDEKMAFENIWISRDEEGKVFAFTK
jgi:hypothetical protein